MANLPATSPNPQQPLCHRYFRRVGINQKPVVIDHNLGQIPLVNLYELQPILALSNVSTPPKFYLYCGHDERQAVLTAMGISGSMILGTSLQTMLTAYNIEVSADDSLNDVINDFVDTFFALPNADEIDYHTSVWIDQHRDRVVKDLQAQGEWDDVCWFMLPNQLSTGRITTFVNGQWVYGPQVTLCHLNYNSLAVTAVNDSAQSGQPNQFIDLMIFMSQ